MKKISIGLWKPDKTLYNDIKKLDPNEYEIKEIQMEELNKYSFDYMLVAFEQFREHKKQLIEMIGIDSQKVFTFNEFRVKDSEEIIQAKYYEFWKAMYKADIQTFRGKNVCITGGSSGVGAECAKAFLLMGANVIIAGRNKDSLERVSKEAAEFGSIKFIEWDISNISQGEEKLEKCEKLVDGKLEILLNCAGIWEGKTFFEVTEGDFDSILHTNLKGTYFMCQLFAKYYVKNYVKGHIVNVISNVGNLPTVKPYGVSKWGLVGLTKGLGLSLAEYGVTVNGIAPGAIATSLAGWKKGDCPARRNSKTGRLAFPCEIAHLVLQLAGFFGENMPGEIIECDGGDKTIGINL